MRRNIAKMAEAIFDELVSACDVISDAGACASCPVKNYCIEETSAVQFFCDTPDSRIDEFLGFADDVRNFESDQARQNQIWFGEE